MVKEKNLKSKKRKNSDLKTLKAKTIPSRVKNVSPQLPKKAKIEKNQSPQPREFKKKKKKKKKKQRKKLEKTWRDYLYLYDGKEYFARLHFKCMRSFKLRLIAQCVDEEFIEKSKNKSEDGIK